MTVLSLTQFSLILHFFFAYFSHVYRYILITTVVSDTLQAFVKFFIVSYSYLVVLEVNLPRQSASFLVQHTVWVLKPLTACIKLPVNHRNIYRN